ncbi:hypothetical protein D9757_008260 [Collybiopsis confluens]|uniref:Ribosome biogenesis protein NOP53 n=1 Tax=Collybiopsis confluens TaxID=2823264 RepID=A0A8H5M0X2_9AGAR|nr:hypothetical protein D9757_008260 [Collybiopsis confluens]
MPPASAKKSQPSRKGKKTWRKNVDLKDVEDRLEERREEERLFGGALSQKLDSALFQIDREGDDDARLLVPKPKSAQLTSLKILLERSAVPAVYSRKNKPTGLEKDRLFRLAKRPKKGPFGAIVEQPDGWSSAGVSEAVKSSGHYDPWAPTPISGSESIPLAFANLSPSHAPSSTSDIAMNPRTFIELPAVPLPHAGTSYNPPVQAHTELIHRAYNQEQVRSRGDDRWKDVGQAVKDVIASTEDVIDVAAQGMTVDVPVDEEAGDQTEAMVPLKKIPQRKTKAERRKAGKALAEKRLLAQRAAKRRQLSYLSELSAKRSRKMGVRQAPLEIGLERKKWLQEKIKKGLAGTRFGKHRVAENAVDVQLGEELSESLRGMKVEGNLFKDRFLNLQQRALIEPRLRVLPKRRRVRMVEYEKHGWKRFDA